MRIIIVGGNHAGIAAALRIREEYPDDEVIVFEKKDEITFVSQTIPIIFDGTSRYPLPSKLCNTA